MLVLSCARVLLVCLGSVCSVLLTLGASVFIILFGCLFDRCDCTASVCIVFMFCLICDSVGFVMVCGMFIVYLLLGWNMDVFISRGGIGC